MLPNAPESPTTQGLRDRATIAVLRAAVRSTGPRCGARRWARFGRIHAGGDGCRTAREYAGAVGMVTLPVLLTVRVIAAEVFPHFAPVSPPAGAHPPRCQRNRRQDTQNPAHRYSLLLRNLAVNCLAVPHVPHAARRHRTAIRRGRLPCAAHPQPHAGGRGDGQRAAGARTGRRHRPREEREVDSASGPATGSPEDRRRRSCCSTERYAGPRWRRPPTGAVRAVHAGGDDRRTAGEYAGVVGVAPAISDGFSVRLAGSRRGGWLTLRHPQAPRERAGHHDHPGAARPRDPRRAARLCATPVRGGGARRWALFRRIHAGGDGRRTAREYAGAGGVVDGRFVSAISDRSGENRLKADR
jgi:hypothetical protein